MLVCTIDVDDVVFILALSAIYVCELPVWKVDMCVHCTPL